VLVAGPSRLGTPSGSNWSTSSSLPALDALATVVEVRVNLPCWWVQVTDNGCGMVYEDFALVGEHHGW
jgi:hypothetical protein